MVERPEDRAALELALRVKSKGVIPHHEKEDIQTIIHTKQEQGSDPNEAFWNLAKEIVDSGTPALAVSLGETWDELNGTGMENGIRGYYQEKLPH